MKHFIDDDRFASDPLLYEKLNLILLIIQMESFLRVIINYWNEACRVFDLNPEDLTPFLVTPDDYLPIIQESPIGNRFGFMYSDPKNHSLQLFRYKGVGRYLLLNFPSLFSLSDNDDGPQTVYLSGTSWALGSTNYHFQKEPDAVIKMPPSFLKGPNAMKFIFRPMYREDRVIKVSGSKDKKSREQNLKDILDGLTKQNQSPMTKDSILEQELKAIEDPKRKRLLLLVGSYHECETTTEYLQNIMRVREGWTKESIVQLVSDAKDSENNPSILHRGRVSQFPEGVGKILVAPLLAIERGFNILNDEGCAAIGTLFFLVRPMPVPSDMLPVTLSLNHWAIKYLSKVHSSFKTMGDWGMEFRQKAVIHWRQCMEAKGKGLKALYENELYALYWNQFVIIWQVIGRIIRGGVPARILFVDGAFVNQSSRLKEDTEKKSLLEGIEKILHPYFNEDTSIPIYHKEVAQNLYRPFYDALKKIEGVN